MTPWTPLALGSLFLIILWNVDGVVGLVLATVVIALLEKCGVK